jgi:ferredoxin-NADP reductase/truncated hemoglobin YjbI/ferredoxin
MSIESSRWISFEGETYHLAAGERALDAMLRRGAPVTFSCRKGSCHSCMMQVVSGDPGADGQTRLPQKLRDLGFFLPCCTTAPQQLVASRPDWSLCTHEALVAEKTVVAPGVFRLRLEPATVIDWRAGQTVALIALDGTQRTYSIASIADQDYYLDLHICHYPGGAVSEWVATGLSPGDTVTLQGPSGSFTYDPALADAPLTLVGTGTGQGAVLAVARDALLQGHRAAIHLVLGARMACGLYLADEARALAASHPNLRVTLAASREAAFGQPSARATALAFGGDMTGHAVFLCGAPGMVEAARVAAVAHGVAQRQIFADPFDPPELYQTEERAKLASLKPDPTLWAALDHGPGLTRILEDFYTQVYADPRLAPYFHRTTKQRAVEKQFSFLRDIFLGVSDYFGERPFNAHHWMVISDELFTHREELFFATVRRHGIAEDLIRPWAAMHELFRRDIVKPAPRGQLFFGVERQLEGYSTETLGVATVCDSCTNEIHVGQTAQMHKRTGELFCNACASK